MTILDPDVAAASASLVAAHKRVVKEKNRLINQLQAEKGELQRALQAKAGEVVRAKMQAVDALDEAIEIAETSRPVAAGLIDQMRAAWKASDNDMAPNDGDTLIVWKGRDWWEVGTALPGRPLDKRLARVLSRPPARPEGAEEIESQIESWSMTGDGGVLDAKDHRTLADFLAERGVRVTGGN